jgi:hypothetical protein
MDNLIVWLRQQLDDDERISRGARPGYFTFDVLSQFSGLGDMAHVINHNPARELAEVDAKRQILDEVLRYEAKIDGEWGCLHSAEQIGAGQCMEIRPSGVVAIRLLALPYAGRPGWREEWVV